MRDNVLETAFVLKNGLSQKIYVHLAVGADREMHFVTVLTKSGQLVHHFPSQCLRSCSGGDSACEEADRLADPLPPILELEPGASFEERWNALIWNIVESQTNPPCLDTTVAEQTKHNVQFCWAARATQSELQGEVCELFEFTPGIGERIVKTVDQLAAQPITFELENKSGRTVMIYPSLGCSPAAGWVAVIDDLGRELPREPACDVCTCANAPCGFCDCAQHPPVELADGETVTEAWDGTYLSVDPGPNCAMPTIAVGAYTARFSWIPLGPGPNTPPPFTTDLSFVIGSGSVHLAIDPPTR